jgi:hypothetical protein
MIDNKNNQNSTAKSYLVNVGGKTEVWDEATYTELKDALYNKYPDANMFEMDNMTDFSAVDDEMQYVVNTGDRTETWDAATMKELGSALKEKYPNATVQSLKYKDYWYDKALADEEKLNAMKPQLDSLQEQLSMPRFRDASKPDSLQLKYDEMKSEYDALQSAYDSNPRVIAYNEEIAAEQAEAQKNLPNELRRQIGAAMSRSADEYKWIKSQLDYEGYSVNSSVPMPEHLKALGGNDDEYVPKSPEELLKELKDRRNEDIAEKTERKIAIPEPKRERRDATRVEFRPNVGGKAVGYYNAATEILDAYDYLTNNKSSVAQGIWYNWSESVSSEANEKVHEVLKKLEAKCGNLNEVTPEDIEKNLGGAEKTLLQSYFLLMEEEAKTSKAFRGGEIAGESAKIAAEVVVYDLALNALIPGAGTAAHVASTTSKATKVASAISKWYNSGSKLTKLGKGVVKLTGATAKLGMKATGFTALAPTTYSHIAKKKLTIGDDGKLKDSDEDIMRYFAEDVVENFTELSGEGVLKLFGKAGDLAKGTRIGAKIADRMDSSWFGKAGKWLATNSGTKWFKRAGFHGLPVEVFEEFEGAVINQFTGLDENAISNFADKDNLTTMMIGFAPMTLLGMGSGIGTYAYASHSVNKNAKNLSKVLLDNGYNEEQVKYLLNYERQMSPESLGKEINNVLAVMEQNGASAEAKKAVTDYAVAVGRYKALEGSFEAQQPKLKNKKLKELNSKYGTFYQTKNDGKNKLDEVTTTYVLPQGETKGRDVFIVSEKNDNGQYDAIDVNTGERLKVSDSEIALLRSEDMSPVFTTRSLDTYLTERVMQERQKTLSDYEAAYENGQEMTVADLSSLNEQEQQAKDNLLNTGITSRENSFTEDSINLSSSELLSLSEQEEFTEEESNAIRELAIAKRTNEGLIDKLKQPIISSIDSRNSIASNASNNGTLTVGTHNGKTVYVKGGVQTSNGSIVKPDNAKGYPVEIVDAATGEVSVVDSKEVTNAGNVNTATWNRSYEVGMIKAFEQKIEELRNAKSPDAILSEVYELVGKKVYLNINDNIILVEVDQILPSMEVLIKGKKGDLGGKSVLAVGIDEFYNMIYRDANGKPILPKEEQDESDATDYRGETVSILINGVPASVEVISQDNSSDSIVYEYTDENGNIRRGSSTISGFEQAIKQANEYVHEQPNVPEEVPVAETQEQPIEEATSEEVATEEPVEAPVENMPLDPESINWDELFEQDKEAYFIEMQNQFGEEAVDVLNEEIEAAQSELDALGKAKTKSQNDRIKNRNKKKALQSRIDALNEMVARLTTPAEAPVVEEVTETVEEAPAVQETEATVEVPAEEAPVTPEQPSAPVADTPAEPAAEPAAPVAPNPVADPVSEAKNREERLLSLIERKGVSDALKRDSAFNAGKEVADFFATYAEFEEYEAEAKDLGNYYEDFARGVKASFANRPSNESHIGEAGLEVSSEAQELTLDAVLESLDNNIEVEAASDQQAQAMLDVKAELSGIEAMTVYHGSPHKFSAFDHSKMGTGEGAQAHGWGTYVAVNRQTSEEYADVLRGRLIKITRNGFDISGNVKLLPMDAKTPLELIATLIDWYGIDIAKAELEKGLKEAEQKYKESSVVNSEYRRAKVEMYKNASVLLNSGSWKVEQSLTNLYTVNIPEDSGSNYFGERELTDRQMEMISDACEREGVDFLEVAAISSALSDKREGARLYKALSEVLGSPKDASEFLSRAGFTGIKYTGNVDGDCFVIFNESDAKITGHVEFYQTPNGTVYGWTDGNKIYLTKAGFNPNTPIHEYTHLWAKAMMQNNPKGWNSVKSLLKGTPIWNEVINDPNYSDIKDNEDAVASEALSRLSGSQNAAKMEQMAQQMIDEAKGTMRKAKARGLIQNMKDALAKFWNWVGTNLFGIEKFDSVEQVTDRVLWDLLNKTNLGELSEGQVEASIIPDGDLKDKLQKEIDNGEYITLYRAVRKINGKYYSPKMSKLGGVGQEIVLGQLEKSDERPDLAYPVQMKDGSIKYKVNLDGGDPAGTGLKSRTTNGVDYNPYIHASDSMMNDQFTAAFAMPEMTVIEVRVPKSELTSGYHAQHAADHVGLTPWKSGTVDLKLPNDEQRNVYLSRYDMPVREVPTEEIADHIAAKLLRNGLSMPYNLVTPQVAEALIRRGVDVSEKPSGNVSAGQNEKFKELKERVLNEMKDNDTDGLLFRSESNPITPEMDAEYLAAVERGDMETAQRMVDEAARAAGYTEKVLHGTQNFGFTRIDVNKADDNLSFFATDDERVAHTYSSVYNTREINADADYSVIDEIEAELEERAREEAYDLADSISSFAGYYGFIDGSYIHDTFKELSENYSSEEADNRMYEFADDAIYNAYDRYSYEGKEFADWQESDEAQELYTVVNQTIQAYISYARFKDNSEDSGNYDLYANVEDFFVIDGKGQQWSNIKSEQLPDITSEEYQKYGYRGHRDRWTTRSVSRYAHDLGYKGVLFKDIVDDGGRGTSKLYSAANVYSFFYPQQQVKSADPVTYDDAGNVIPLSERFNPEKKDIRYRKGENNTKFVEQFEFKQNNEKQELEYSDEFRRLQEESARMSGQLVSEKDGVQQAAIRGLVGGIGRTLQRELDRATSGRGNKLRTVVNDSKGTSFDIIENVDGRLFHDIFEIVRTYLPNGELVDLHDNYDDAICYITSDGLAGFAVDKDGNLISVYSLYGKSKKGFLGAIKDLITEAGATHLDGYNSEKQPLAEIYSKVFGWKVASMMDYNMEYDHDNIAENHGMPQVAFMVNTEAEIETKHFDKDQYDEAVAYQQEQVEVSKRIDAQNAAIDYLAGDARTAAMEHAVNKEASKLGVTVTYKTRSEMPKGHENDKGYYNTKTGEIVICTENNASIADAIQTILHEAVAHKGLRQLMGDKFNEFINRVYNSLDAETKAKVDSLAEKHYNGDKMVAMEEYMASLAENENFAETSVWEKIKSIFESIINSILGRNDIKIGDKELRYILRASYNNMVNPNAMNTIEGWAKDTNMRNELGINEATPEIMSRTGIDPDAVSQETAKQVYDRAVSEGWNEFQRQFQDAYQPVRIAIEAIQQETGNIPIEDYENYLLIQNQTSSRSRVEIDNFERKYYDPIVEQVNKIVDRILKARGMKNNKKNRAEVYAEVRQYMIAKHGLERNEYYRSTKGEDRDYAGLTSLFGFDPTEYEQAEEKAARVVEEFEAELGKTENQESQDINDLWKRINAATDKTLRHSYESGMISRQQYDQIRSMFNFYIPLRGFDETTAEDVYSYARFEGNRFNAAVHKAEGRTSVADDPIATIMNMAESEIAQGNKNRAKQALYNFILNRPVMGENGMQKQNSLMQVEDVWYVKVVDSTGNEVYQIAAPGHEYGETYEEFEERMASLEAEEKAFKSKKGQVDVGKRFQKQRNQNAHYIYLKINGVDKAIYINGDPKAADAVNGTYQQKRQFGEDKFRQINRLISSTFTNYSLEFTARNFFRDMFYSHINMGVKEKDPAYRKTFRKNWRKNNMGTMLKMLKAYRAGEYDNKELNAIESAFVEFMENGGQTGYTLINSVESHKKELEKSLERMRKGSRKGGLKNSTVFKYTLGGIELLNEASELVTRFAAFKTSRDIGRSVVESINDAKEITVNFNTKGAQDGTGWMGFIARYFGWSKYFFNASVQGVQNIKAMANANKLKFCGVVGGMMGLGFLMPVITSAIESMLGGDDDEYWNIPEYDRQNNLCICIGGGDYIKIPLPIGFREIYAMGDMTAALAFDKRFSRDIWSVGMDYANKIASIILPINPLEGRANGLSFWNTFLSTALPSSFQFAIQNATNTDWKGAPLQKEYTWNEDDPQWMKAFNNAPDWMVGLSKWCYENINLDGDFRGLDFSPEKLDNTLSNVFGGVYTLIKKTGNGISAAWNEEERNLSNIPLAGVVFGTGIESDGRFVTDAYFDMKEYYDANVNSIKRVASNFGLSLEDIFVKQKGAHHPKIQEIYGNKNFEWMKDWYLGHEGNRKASSKAEKLGLNQLKQDIKDLQKSIAEREERGMSTEKKEEKLIEKQKMFDEYYRDFTYRLLEMD